MATRAIERLVEAIGYPERAPGGAASFAFLVDGGEIVATETARGLRLTCRLTDGADATGASLPRLAEYAAGRMLREEATLAYGAEGAFLWQEIPARADAHTLRRGFETFCDACDWWRERVSPQDDLGGGEPALNELRILP